MREMIVTDLTRFSTNEKVCTAVIDVDTGECLRPIPYLKWEKCKELGIHPGAILKGDLNFTKNPPQPHIEDSNYSELTYHGPCDGDLFKKILDNSLCTSLSDGFGVPFSLGQKYIPTDQAAKCSIVTIMVKPYNLRIHEDQYKPGKIKASLIDNSGHEFKYLSITDLGFHDYAQKHQSDGKIYEILDFIENQDEIYLRIGLSRAFKSPDGRYGYWLQVNGIYTFPYFDQSVRCHE